MLGLSNYYLRKIDQEPVFFQAKIVHMVEKLASGHFLTVKLLTLGQYFDKLRFEINDRRSIMQWK